jgi:hypothetical protein
MKKIATLFSVLMLFTSSPLFSQTRKEATVKLEWQEQGFIHFYSSNYSVYVSKPDFLNFDNELLIGLFDEYSDKNDSINLDNPFPGFKTEQKDLLWGRLIHCAVTGKMLILSNDSKKKLKNVLIIDDRKVHGSGTEIWECRDPKTNQIIFAHNQNLRITPAF